MTRIHRSPLVLLATVAMLSSGCTSPKPTGAKTYAEEITLQGKQVYERHCAGCHGMEGKGDGPAARFLDPRPRNFVTATYKFRSTPSGYLPTDQDLHRTLREGVHNTSMPSWRLLTEQDRVALVSYLKTFSDRWKDPEEYAPALPLPGAPQWVGDDDSVGRGFDIYAKMQCASCHGADGSGIGATVASLKDTDGREIVPLNFSVRTPKGGASPEDYYRAFTTGLDGTPMPSYGGGVLSEEQRWDLVSYVMALRKYQGKVPAELLPAAGEEGGQ